MLHEQGVEGVLYRRGFGNSGNLGDFVRVRKNILEECLFYYRNNLAKYKFIIIIIVLTLHRYHREQHFDQVR